ncbi:helix-turn-helix domain-containing protein [Halioxenophilus aromaticivorans]|uniref:Helix-turn-helix domain-containing protein n=1 Tax=Halioxenophilus aromaticivorans TaxID=1306992 RepID=A0AAV3U478_9ALTE
MSYLQETLPTPEEVALAKISSRELSAFLETQSESQALSITDKEGASHPVKIPVSALRLLVEVLTQLGEGNTVNLVPVHAELTTQEGADMLNVSRPTFVKLLDDGKIPFHRTGNRRKVKFADVHSYKQEIDQQRLAALEELSALDQSMGMGYE